MPVCPTFCVGRARPSRPSLERKAATVAGRWWRPGESCVPSEAPRHRGTAGTMPLNGITDDPRRSHVVSCAVQKGPKDPKADL